MANTDPVADTAEIVEQVWRPRPRRRAWSTSARWARCRKGLAGETLAEIGNMARSRAAVRVFSDDGRCVHDARLMRRALEYVKPFDAVIAQHAQDPRLADSAACAHEGELSGRLGLPGWPAVAEESIVARDVMLAEHTGSRLHVCHVSTGGSVEVDALGQGARGRRDRRGHAAPPAAAPATCSRATTRSSRSTRRCVRAPTSRRCAPGLADGTIDAVATDHAPHASHDKDHAFADAAFGMLGLETALGVVAETMVATGLLDWAGVADRMSRASGGDRPGGRAGRVDRARVEPANLTLVDPDGAWTVDPAALASRSRNTPFAGRSLPASVVATVFRGRLTVAGGTLVPAGVPA